MYSRVNHMMQMVSSMDSTLLSVGFPSSSGGPENSGMVLRIMATVEMMTKRTETQEMTLAARLDSGFSNRSQRNCWERAQLPSPQYSVSSFFRFSASYNKHFTQRGSKIFVDKEPRDLG